MRIPSNHCPRTLGRYKDGDSLVLTFERSGRGGNTRDVVMTLTLDGEMINATQIIGDGQFSMTGTGKKQP